MTNAASSSKLHPTASASSSSGLPSSVPAQPAKLAANKRLPATMITPSGQIEPSKKSKNKAKQMSKKQKARADKGREKAAELSGKMQEKVKGREDRKAKRQRAKKAWE